MELSDYFQIINRRIWIILVTVAITVVVYNIGSSFSDTTYEASTVMRIVPYESSNPSYTQIAYAERIMNTYIEIASSSPLLDALRQELGLAGDRPNRISVEVIPDTELLQITIEDIDPAVAREAANTLAGMLLEEKPIRDIRISIVEPAITPRPPSVRRNLINSALAFIIGLVGGIGLAFLFENLDTRLHTTEQIVAVTGLPLLGKIPKAKRKNKEKFLIDNVPYADVFRRIRINILSLYKESPLQILMVTSADPNEGKSTIVANLARSLVLTGRRVIIVDADLHCPTIHSIFNLTNELGLSDVLSQNIALSDVIQTSKYPGLDVLTSGSTNSNSTELFGSERMLVILEKLQEQFDLILVDTPAFLGIADTLTMAPYADGVVLVTKCDSVKREELQTTCQQLENVHAILIGVLVNQTKGEVPRKYYKYYQQSNQVENIQKSPPEIENIAKDPLSDIHGIDQDCEKALNTIGIFTFAQLSKQNPNILADKLDGQVTALQIRQWRWIEQARTLSSATDG